jgi:dTDP-glucose 4,6-dehydratase
VNALDGNPIPVYGKGRNIRDWLYVDDHANALWTILTRGRIGETYNVGGNCERSNIELVGALCSIVDRLVPNPELPRHEVLITMVDDRPGHDHRYAVDIGKIESELGWTPAHDIEGGLEDTVGWYLDNEAWWRNVRAEIYGGERLGSGNLGS